MVVPSHFIPLAAPGMISKGLRWMFDPESPVLRAPAPQLGLADLGNALLRSFSFVASYRGDAGAPGSQPGEPAAFL